MNNFQIRLSLCYMNIYQRTPWTFDIQPPTFTNCPTNYTEQKPISPHHISEHDYNFDDTGALPCNLYKRKREFSGLEDKCRKI